MVSRTAGARHMAASEEIPLAGGGLLRLSRVGDVALFMVWMLQGSASAVRAVRHAQSGDTLAAVHVATVAFIMFSMGALFLMRGRPTASVLGARAKIIALIGTWSIVPLASLSLSWQPTWLLTATTFGLIAAYVFVFSALVSL